MTVNLARALAIQSPENQFVLLNAKPFHVEGSPQNLGMQLIEEAEFWTTGSNSDAVDVVVCPATQLVRLQDVIKKSPHGRLVAWVHHPSYFDHRLAGLKIQAEVFVGSYQIQSTGAFLNPNQTAFIPNLFFAPDGNGLERKVRDNGDRTRLVFIGALHIGKGFHLIARQWNRLKQLVPNVELHVIGSSSTYSGIRPEFEDVPADAEYRATILRSIPAEDISNGRVVFHGNLGSEKALVMQNCDVAVLNPTGRTEAFPATVLECLSMGLPTLAANDFGMQDTMAFFPETSVENPNQIPEMIAALNQNRMLYKELSARALAVSEMYASLSESIVLRWLRLLQAVAKSEPLSTRMDRPFIGLRNTRSLTYRKMRGLAGALSRLKSR